MISLRRTLGDERVVELKLGRVDSRNAFLLPLSSAKTSRQDLLEELLVHGQKSIRP